MGSTGRGGGCNENHENIIFPHGKSSLLKSCIRFTGVYKDLQKEQQKRMPEFVHTYLSLLQLELTQSKLLKLQSKVKKGFNAALVY